MGLEVTNGPIGIGGRVFDELIRPFQKYRGSLKERGKGTPISFARFMRERPDGGTIFKNHAGKAITWRDLFVDMGVPLNEFYISELSSRDDQYSQIFGPLIEDMFLKGYIQTAEGKIAWWRKLCAKTGIPSKDESLKRTMIAWEGRPQPTGEIANFPHVDVKYAKEMISWMKEGFKLRMSVEYLQFNPLPAIENALAEIGRVWQVVKNQRAVQTIVNGDLASGANSCPVIGVQDTGKGFQEADFHWIWGMGDEIGEEWHTILCNRETGVNVGLMDMFKPIPGNERIKLENTPEPSVVRRFTSSEVPEKQIINVDVSHCMQERVSIPLSTWNADEPDVWARGLVVGESSTFEIIGDKARVGIQEDLAFAQHPFPAWFELGKYREFEGATE